MDDTYRVSKQCIDEMYRIELWLRYTSLDTIQVQVLAQVSWAAHPVGELHLEYSKDFPYIAFFL